MHSLRIVAMFDELEKIGSVSEAVSKAAVKAVKAEPTTRMGKFLHGAKGEFGPAVGATLGAGLAKMYGVDTLAGAAGGYGIGALPEIYHALKHKV